MTRIHPKHHVRRRHKSPPKANPVTQKFATLMRQFGAFALDQSAQFAPAFTVPREPLQVDARIVAKAHALGLRGAALNRRIEQALTLEAANVSDDLVNIIVKIAASRRLTQDDIQSLHYHAAGGTP